MTKQERFYLYWLDVQIKHVSEYAQVYKKISEKKGEVSERLQKSIPGWTNLLALLEATALASKFRERDYENWVAALRFARDSFKQSMKVKDENIRKARKRLREFVKNNKPKELNLKLE